MGSGRTGARKKTANALSHADFLRYCDQMVERALEAVSLVMKNRSDRTKSKS